MITAKNSVTVYYRPGCHLCDDMMAALQGLQSELNFDIKLSDIDQAEHSIRQRYHVDFPVVEYEGEVLCYHFFDEQALRLALQHE